MKPEPVSQQEYDDALKALSKELLPAALYSTQEFEKLLGRTATLEEKLFAIDLYITIVNVEYAGRGDCRHSLAHLTHSAIRAFLFRPLEDWKANDVPDKL